MTKTIGIFTYSSFTWDPDSIYSGIAGSEEAVIYMSQSLAKLGFRVFVVGNPPENSTHSSQQANPCFVKYPFSSPVDIAIAWRMPLIAKDLRQIAKKVYLWPHDVLCFPVTEDKANAFDDVLWISQWQRHQWMSVTSFFQKFTKIFGNGINPEQFENVIARKNPFSCIYGSNYGRGLEVLLDLWPDVINLFPQATLDIYYGWQHWGTLSQEKEIDLRKKIEMLPNVQEHGKVGHEELHKAFASASFWTYPCTMPETFCITAIKAQLSGTVPVILEGSALKEVVRHGYSCLRKEEYLSLMKKALGNADKISLKDREKMGEFILKEFTWDNLAKQWATLFQENSISTR